MQKEKETCLADREKYCEGKNEIEMKQNQKPVDYKQLKL